MFVSIIYTGPVLSSDDFSGAIIQASSNSSYMTDNSCYAFSERRPQFTPLSRQHNVSDIRESHCFASQIISVEQPSDDKLVAGPRCLCVLFSYPSFALIVTGSRTVQVRSRARGSVRNRKSFTGYGLWMVVVFPLPLSCTSHVSRSQLRQFIPS